MKNITDFYLVLSAWHLKEQFCMPKGPKVLDKETIVNDVQVMLQKVLACFYFVWCIIFVFVFCFVKWFKPQQDQLS
jgi:uncharacterized membrane protein YccF (DUF307 family)